MGEMVTIDNCSAHVYSGRELLLYQVGEHCILS